LVWYRRDPEIGPIIEEQNLTSRYVKGIALALGLVVAGPSWATFTGVFVIGDSLSDTGNATIAANDAGYPFEVPPSPPYSDGRFSNGLTYIDVLSSNLGMPVTASLLGGTNYAYGGARTDTHPFGDPAPGNISPNPNPLLDWGGKNLLQQRDQILSDVGLGGLGARDLMVVFGGSNDLQNILGGLDPDPVPVAIEDTVVNLSNIIASLYGNGARQFLVPNAPNLGRVPRVIEAGAAAVAGGLALSQAFNAALTTALDQLDALLIDATITRFDTFALLEEIAINGTFGNTTDRCYNGDDLTFLPVGSVCADPDTYLFWDGIHPTTRAHAILGAEMTAALVPAPAPLVLVALGAVAIRLGRLPWRHERR
jgi:outer membrane lipase/esterase